MTSQPNAPRFARTALTVVVFAIAMGYVESAVVVDLRAALGQPAAPTFPLQLADAATGHLAWIEVGREAATIVMLACIGLLLGRRGWEWLAWMAVAFGVWDIAYYGWLAVFIGWPTSPFDMDLLFLIPVPWVGPVWAPVAVSIALVVVGLLAARRYHQGRDPRVRGRHLVGGALGGGLVLFSLMLDAPGILAGNEPAPFAWPPFIAGMAVAVTAAVDALRSAPRAAP
ncbi:MAG: hypothetical protein FJ038_11600 [Chloroflexi bacterium]|nr:hypothetical protein [Chloroflexota bacterium]